jgi:miniconductance mechanosensitive channel
MPARHADGIVTDITLNTVKIQNWDKTITTVPTYSLVSESFTNWIGMIEAEGRRIRRSVFIDLYSIQMSTPELFRKIEKFDFLREYFKTREMEIKEFFKDRENASPGNYTDPVSTNIGLFRKYIEIYLKNHPAINQEMDIMVRQLQSGDKGVPVEIVAFCKHKTWAEFESVQGSMFDHIFAILPEFGLRVFQSPSGIPPEAMKLFQGS